GGGGGGRGVGGVWGRGAWGLRRITTRLETRTSFCPPGPLLAEGGVLFAGEPIAVGAASTRYIAEDAAELVEIELEALEPLLDPLLALEDDSPRLHDEPTNIYMEARTEAGDVEGAFADAPAGVGGALRRGRGPPRRVE